MIILIESPHKEKLLRKALQYNNIDAIIISSFGRLFDLPSAILGVNDSLGIESFEPVNARHFERIQAKLSSHDDLYVATDPDDEGDLIAWTVSRYRGDLATYRLRFFDLTPSSLKQALESFQPVSSQEPAALARRIFDRLLGYSGNDGMFLSRTAGTVLQLAATQSIPVTKFVRSHAGSSKDIQFNTTYLNANNVSISIEDNLCDGALPRYAHCLELGAELSATPQEVFKALQELYADGQISYFRTSSGDVNGSATVSMDTVESDTGIENFSVKTQGRIAQPHAGIYVTSGSSITEASPNRSPLAQILLKHLLNATLCAMAGPGGFETVKRSNDGVIWSGRLYSLRGQTFSYPQTTHALGDDVMTGAPREWSTEKSYPIGKESAIALSLVRCGIGHPSSWAGLSHNYACLLDRNGHLSSRGAAFYRKHQSEAALLLEPEVARQIESTLLNPNEPTADKVYKSLKLCGLTPEGMGLSLSPTSSREADFSTSAPSP